MINEEAEQEDVYCASQDHGYPKRGLGYPANLDEGGRDFPGMFQRRTTLSVTNKIKGFSIVYYICESE